MAAVVFGHGLRTAQKSASKGRSSSSSRSAPPKALRNLYEDPCDDKQRDSSETKEDCNARRAEEKRARQAAQAERAAKAEKEFMETLYPAWIERKRREALDRRIQTPVFRINGDPAFWVELQNASGNPVYGFWILRTAKNYFSADKYAVGTTNYAIWGRKIQFFGKHPQTGKQVLSDDLAEDELRAAPEQWFAGLQRSLRELAERNGNMKYRGIVDTEYDEQEYDKDVGTSRKYQVRIRVGPGDAEVAKLALYKLGKDEVLNKVKVFEL